MGRFYFGIYLRFLGLCSGGGGYVFIGSGLCERVSFFFEVSGGVCRGRWEVGGTRGI